MPTKKQLIAIIFLAFTSLSNHSFPNSKVYKSFYSSYLYQIESPIASGNDTLLFGNVYLKHISTQAHTQLKVYQSISPFTNQICILLPGPDSFETIWSSSFAHVDHFEFLDFNQDQQDEIVIETTMDFGGCLYRNMFILALTNTSVDTLFHTTGFSFKSAPPENIDLIAKTFFYKIKDYNKDNQLDVKLKTIRKYTKDRKCDCDKDHFYRVRKQLYYFKNGIFTE